MCTTSRILLQPVTTFEGMVYSGSSPVAHAMVKSELNGDVNISQLIDNATTKTTLDLLRSRKSGDPQLIRLLSRDECSFNAPELRVNSVKRGGQEIL